MRVRRSKFWLTTIIVGVVAGLFIKMGGADIKAQDSLVAAMRLVLVNYGQGGQYDVYHDGMINTLDMAYYVYPQIGSASRVTAVLVRTIDTSQWSIPAPDPAGITYLPETNRYLVSDCEVDEMPPYWHGKNVFEMSSKGVLLNTYSTIAYSHEPTGLAVNPNEVQNKNVFFSDDDQHKIFVVNKGGDGVLNTIDDIVTSFSTQTFGCVDTEEVEYADGKLLMLDGAGAEVYQLTPGQNGIFDGVAPNGDDQMTHFDTWSLGQHDPEGLAYNPTRDTLYIAGNEPKTEILEVKLNGELVQVIDISQIGAVAPSGLGYGPGSIDPSKNSLFLTDRGVDNNVDPSENDGKIYELSITGEIPVPTATLPPVPSPTPPAVCPAKILGQGYHPQVAGNTAVWVDKSTLKIVVYPLPAGPARTISSDSGTNPAIGNNRVVWSGQRGVVTYVLPHGPEQIVSNNNYSHGIISATTNTIVVWSDTTPYSDWNVLLSPIGGPVIIVALKPYNQHDPDISGNAVVWVDENPTNRGISFYSLDDGMTRRISNGDDYRPAVWGNTVVWSRRPDLYANNYDIYLTNLSNPIGSLTAVTNDNVPQDQPDISASWIVWVEYKTDENGDIILYRRRDGRKFRLTNNSAMQYQPAVAQTSTSNWAIWEDETGGDSIYMCDLNIYQ